MRFAFPPYEFYRPFHDLRELQAHERLFRKVNSAAVFWWGGRLWPPIVWAGTEARPTKIFLF